MAGAPLPGPEARAIESGTIAHALVAALDGGHQQIHDQLYRIAHADDPPTEQPGLTTVLVASGRDGDLVGAFMAFPPFGVLSEGAQQGLPVDLMLALGAVIVRFTGLAVDEPLRGLGIGSALLRGALRLYSQIGYLLIYGQFPAGRGLEDYYPRFGFDVLEPGQPLTLHRLNIGLRISAGIDERLMQHWVQHT